ncbi:MAG: hypothetical protein AB8B80_11030 [Marinicellaceae bacterium]
MNFHESQNDMRQAYLGGATGALSSGLVWCFAGVMGVYFSPVNSMLTLFIGGMFIFPLSILFSKLLGSSGKHSQNNVLNKLALENLGILFGGLFVAFVSAQYNHAVFYPIMLIIMGARYLTFQTLYGLKIYWIFGAILMASGMCIAALSMPFVIGAFVGGIIETVFAMIIYQQNR